MQCPSLAASGCLLWRIRGQNPDRPHQAQLRCTRQMRHLHLHLRLLCSCVCECLHLAVRVVHDASSAENDLLLPAHCAARSTANEFRSTTGCGRRTSSPKTSHAWPCSSPMHCASLTVWVIGCKPREPEECPKIVQQAVVCASCVHKRRFCASWRAANGDESSHRPPLAFWNGHRSRLLPVTPGLGQG